MLQQNHPVSVALRARPTLIVASLVTLCFVVNLSAAAGGGTAGPQDLGAPAVEGADQPVPTALSAEQRALEKPLRNRAQARWNAVIARDFAKAYAFETPEYRQNHTATEYATQFGGMVDWLGARLGSVRYENPHHATVDVLLRVKFPLGADEATTEARVGDRWVYRDKEWWRLDVEQPTTPSAQTKPSPPK